MKESRTEQENGCANAQRLSRAALIPLLVAVSLATSLVAAPYLLIRSWLVPCLCTPLAGREEGGFAHARRKLQSNERM